MSFDSPEMSLYGLVSMVGLLVGGWIWSRRWTKKPESISVFIGAICGAYLGAKVLYLLAEGWLYFGEPGWGMQWLTGKTIVGALLGGYAGVELVKWMIERREPTGDWFAIGVPISIAVGRLGCLRHGCCLGRECPDSDWWSLVDSAGITRWPAVPLELAFNLLFVAAILPLAMRKAGRGQLFHFYLISYGAFRFFHEFQRETPKVLFGLSGYQLGAIGLIVLGTIRFRQRALEQKHVAEGSSNAGENEPPADAAGEAEEK